MGYFSLEPRHSAKVTAKVADKVIEAFKIINFPSDDPKNRTRFEGALKNGIPSGKGTMTWTSGGSYIGKSDQCYRWIRIVPM